MSTKDISIDQLGYIVDFLNTKQPKPLTIKNFTSGKFDEDNSTLVKNFPRIYYFNRRDSVVKVFKANKMVLQYGSGKGIHYSNADIIIFKSMQYLQLTNVSEEVNEEKYLEKFNTFISEREESVDRLSSFIVIMNKDIDYLTIRFSRSISHFPSLD
mmetsp:Transcript_37405/g.42957  ORF Transcript_37405/g.42957 Transcript_37405/m.42957 type:complete len:156 (+) Transcript_37405:206-673(+)